MIAFPLPAGVHLTRAFHLARAARERYGVDDALVDLRGRVLVIEPATAERLAAAMRRAHAAEPSAPPAPSGAELLAAALLDEAVHLMLAHYRREVDPTWSRDLDAALHLRLGHARLREARVAFLEAFPPLAVVRGDVGVEGWLSGRVDGLPAGEVALEERIAVRLANENPALRPLRTLFDDRDLGTADRALAAALERAAREAPGLPGAPGETSLWATLRAPLRASPDSLEGQLAFVRTHWGARLGPAFAALVGRVDRALGTLRERAVGGPPGPPGPAPVLDAAALQGSERAEVEAFSPDADWMPGVVLVAKNAYVWLDQLSRWTGRDVRTLADVPDAALAELRAYGFDALWLIGLWERSEASARIKRRRGQEDAVASAYALWDYAIADDLGGEAAWRDLRDRAARHGLRLAADMVPNHVGIDGRWVVEHPDRLLSLDAPPFPGYTFTGPDLSGDPRVEVRLEDGYWDGSDAAVVFERTDVATQERRYVYHGNDGTSMPWNDTAQIDLLNPEAREALVQVVLDVAKRFPIIRFDAAMTLAKKHVRRLWYPAPGEGGAIPTRSEHGTTSDAAFEAAMPTEFWREVVDRVAREAPGTLLLAEAFWMMEGYFVRTLGMHRVYNSAFMNMLAREANADYQDLVRNVLAFDAKVLGRFVNFMNNPDEAPAIRQFGDGDKAFGVTALMATLPGLPMFGHGQVEGLHEKYGMEYRRAKWDERPNEALVARHRREIAPLLARRATFAGTERFRWFEARGEGGPAPDVFAYANAAPGGAWAIVAYHNRYADVHVALRDVAPWTTRAGATPKGGTLASALALEGGADRFVRWREHPSGLEHLARSDAWREGGLELHLGAYDLRVLLDVHEVRDPDGSLRRLHDHLGGRGVPDLRVAARDVAFAPVHRAWAQLLRAPSAPSDAALAAWVRRARDADPTAARVLAAHPWGPGDGEDAPDVASEP
ncbi:MAG: alpha-amylase family glycosyl hydrolase, partial [Trueperaceae bacterium]|nr:alpha-amylase family glycosyl hydrolase [Trueperaceae bacterium]